jgi:hypothetical protein
VVGATVGILCGLGHYRRLADALLILLRVLGVLGLVAAAGALAFRQPPGIWFPLFLAGILALLPPLGWQKEMGAFGGTEAPGLRA